MPKPLKILQASAGSGKTFSLAVHYLILLFSGSGKYREILAVTFTNKATGEMKSRILEVLKGLAQSDTSKKIDDYRVLILKAYPHLNPESLQEQADSIYRRILHDYSRFSVSTIDGFVQKVIRGFAFELGLDASYSLEMNIDKVKENLVERLDKELDKSPELVKSVIRLAKERIEGDKSWNYKSELLNLTGEIFKERFAGFEEALNQLGPEDSGRIFEQCADRTKGIITNFEERLAGLSLQAFQLMQKHHVRADILKGKSRNPLLKLEKAAAKDFNGLERVFILADAPPDDWFQKNCPQDSYDDINPILKELRDFYESSLPDYVLAQQFAKNVYYLRLMQELVVLLKAYREESGNLLISDAQNLLSGITRDAGDNPSFIWEKIGSRYRNFLFDEFQDTSVSQWGSFKSLVQNAIAAPSQNLTDHLIVGDTKQSIYRWRNGDWNILHTGAKQDLGAHNIFDDMLEENYRSASRIIEFNNYLYKELPKLLQNKLNNEVSDISNPDLSSWWNEQSYNEIINSIYAGAEQKFTSKTPQGGVVKIKKYQKEESDERMFSDTVFREYALNSLIPEIHELKENHQYQYKDISILVRTNKEAVEAVEALMLAQIPVVSGEALLLANNSAVKLLLNTLYMLSGYQGNISLYKANCIALYNRIKKQELNPDSYLNLRHKKIEELAGLLPVDLCENAQTWLQLPLPELIEKLIKSYGLDIENIHLPYLFAFRDLIGNAVRQGEKGILSFLSWWDEDGYKKTLPSPEEADAVQVLTIHKSKGLAFRAVFIPFCNLDLCGKSNSIFWVPSEGTPYQELGSIPLKYSRDLGFSSVAKYYFEEELYSHMDTLNMLYVATTRAVDYLYIGIKARSKEDELGNIGDALNQLYSEELDPENTFKIEEYLIREPREEHKNLVVLDEYPTSGRIAEIYRSREEKHVSHLLNTEEAGREGSILHQVLASVKGKEDIDEYLSSLNQQGIITADEITGLKQQTLEVLDHPELQQLLAKADKTIEEKNIIDEKGRLHRPDKVLIKGDEIIIIDYKFTQKEFKEHEEQLQGYKNLFYAMGHQKVSAYLFYAAVKNLKAV